MASRRPSSAKGASFADVVRLGLDLPGVEESTSYGTPALKVGGKLFVRLKEDAETLVLKMDAVNRGFLLEAEPNLFYITDHYRDYPWILLRLSEVKQDRLKELLDDAWRLAAPPRIRKLREPDR